MKTSTRVIFNTIVLYLKVVLSLGIAFVSVPLVLDALGARDYGLYNLIAGVVAMLAFLNNAMTVSSQRYMSVAMGEQNVDKINSIYNSSFLLHLGLGLLIVVTFEIVGIFAIDKLNIEPDRVWCAKVIYQFLIFSTFCRIIAVPFDALINAKEDMISLSVIELIDSLLMLGVAFSIAYIPGDRLIYYGLCVAGISGLTLIIKYSWCIYRYKETRLKMRAFKDRLHAREMIGFTGWNLFGGLATIGRNQGVAIVINLFLGTIANAAYGIANQINGALSHFSTTFQKAINPQLMKSEGMNDRGRLIRISFISSKFSVLALAMFAVPLIIEMNEVLTLWLKKEAPAYTLRLTQLILLLSIVSQYSVGIMSAIQATGRIRNYQIVVGSLLLLNVPLAYVMLKMGYPVYYTIACFIVMEIISLVIRLFMAEKLIGMKFREYFINVLRPTFVVIIISLAVSLIPTFIMDDSLVRLIVVCSLYCVLFISLTFKYAFDKTQRAQITTHIYRFFRVKK